MTYGGYIYKDSSLSWALTVRLSGDRLLGRLVVFNLKLSDTRFLCSRGFCGL